MSKFNLNINERVVLLQTESLRVVGIGRSGWRIDMVIEQGHKDALGDTSWHTLSQYEMRSDHTSVKDSIEADALLAAVGRIRDLERELDRANQHINGLEATP